MAGSGERDIRRDGGGEPTRENGTPSPRAFAIAKRHFQERQRTVDSFREHMAVFPSPIPYGIEGMLVTATAHTIDGLLRNKEQRPHITEIADRVSDSIDARAAKENILRESYEEESEVPDVPTLTKDIISNGSVFTPGYASLQGLVAMSLEAERMEQELGLPEGSVFADDKHFGTLVRKTYGSAEAFATQEFNRIDHLPSTAFKPFAAQMVIDAPEFYESIFSPDPRILQFDRGEDAVLSDATLISDNQVAIAEMVAKRVMKGRCLLEEVDRFWGEGAGDTLSGNIRSRLPGFEDL